MMSWRDVEYCHCLSLLPRLSSNTSVWGELTSYRAGRSCSVCISIRNIEREEGIFFNEPRSDVCKLSHVSQNSSVKNNTTSEVCVRDSASFV